MNTVSFPHKASRRLPAQVSLAHRSASFPGRIAAAIAGVLLISFVPLVLRAQVATGAITGRILNEGTGQYLRSAVITVAGTNLSTVAEAGGVYTLTGVPPGEARLAVSFEGLDPVEAAVTVTAGQTLIRDFAMGTRRDDSSIVKLGAFVVVTEREGNFKAVQEQKSALEMKTVVASDAFGDVAEGNVSEFMKFMPGVVIDGDAEAYAISIGGMGNQYTLVLMDGAPVAAAGSSDITVGRRFETEQLSVGSIESVELSKTPTPDVAGSALAGVVNLRSKGAFDRKGRQIRWSASSGLNSHDLMLKKTPGVGENKSRKVGLPNGSLEFSDVMLDGKLGVMAGASFARTLLELNYVIPTYAMDTDPANNPTEIPRVSSLQFRDVPKITDRANYNLRFDYKASPNLSGWFRTDYNTYWSEWHQHDILLNFANAVNGPAANSPTAPGVEYSLSTQTSTAATAQISMGTGGPYKHGATTTLTTGVTFKRGAFRADAQGQVSVSTNYYDDLEFGPVSGGSMGTLSNLSFRWDRRGPGDFGINLTQLAGADWRNPNSYTAAANPFVKTDISGKDQKWTGKADFRYDLPGWRIPTTVKWGGDVSQGIRDVIRGVGQNYTYLGADGRAGTGDERWPLHPNYTYRNLAGGNVNGIFTIDPWAMAREFNAHPERFIAPTPQVLLQNKLTTHWDVKEQIDSLYSQTIFKFSQKLDIAPGVRLEKTRSAGRGPTDIGIAGAREALTGNPRANIPTTTLEFIQARYGSEAINESTYHTWLKYLHATYRFNSNLLLRTSFNDSITRPNLNNLAGSVTLNPDATSLPISTIMPTSIVRVISRMPAFPSITGGCRSAGMCCGGPSTDPTPPPTGGTP